MGRNSAELKVYEIFGDSVPSEPDAPMTPRTTTIGGSLSSPGRSISIEKDSPSSAMNPTPTQNRSRLPGIFVNFTFENNVMKLGRPSLSTIQPSLKIVNKCFAFIGSVNP